MVTGPVSSSPLIGRNCRGDVFLWKDLRCSDNFGLCAGENRTAEFTKLNPMKKVPVMVDNSFTLTERYAHTLLGRQVMFREESSLSIVYSHFRHVLEFLDLFQVLTLAALNPIKIYVTLSLFWVSICIMKDSRTSWKIKSLEIR